MCIDCKLYTHHDPVNNKLTIEGNGRIPASKFYAAVGAIAGLSPMIIIDVVDPETCKQSVLEMIPILPQVKTPTSPMFPKFVQLVNNVPEIPQDQVARYGGASGIRDIELLKSALGIPSATYGGQFQHTAIFEMAAAYLFHLVKNHPFVDGNKRTGAVAALIFLALNNFDVDSPEDDLAEMVLAVARSDLDKADVAVFIRRCHQLQRSPRAQIMGPA